MATIRSIGINWKRADLGLCVDNLCVDMRPHCILYAKNRGCKITDAKAVYLEGYIIRHISYIISHIIRHIIHGGGTR